MKMASKSAQAFFSFFSSSADLSLAFSGAAGV
jgi:hypothetical protein